MRIKFAVLFVISCLSAHAQVIPSEGDTVNYLIAGFAVPKNKEAVKYVFKVAEGKYNITDAEEFAKHIVAQSKPGMNKQVLELPAFGKEYTWTVSYTDKLNKLHASTQYYHFRTGYVDRINPQKNRLRIISLATKHIDAYVVLDKSGIMYDMNGNPVWYLPNANNSITDLKPTLSGTFTYLDDDGAYEIDYSGNILWKAPDNGRINGENTERYHHQLTKLNNGHYMVMGYETVLRPHTDSYIPPDSLRNQLFYKEGRWFSKVDAGTLMEYDIHGNVVWSWKASSEYSDDKYFGKSYWETALIEKKNRNKLKPNA
jgi:hypothetical protein